MNLGPLFYWQDLKKMQCSEPGCTHDHSDSDMFLHQNCHFQRGAIIEIFKGEARFKCFVCKMPIARIAVDVYEFNRIEQSSCCSAPVWVSFRNKRLIFSCSKCEQALFDIGILELE